MTAVDWTISSSKPKLAVMRCSIHCETTARLIFPTISFLAKLLGNLVFRRALFKARASSTDAVPLMDGMVWSLILVVADTKVAMFYDFDCGIERSSGNLFV